MTSSNLPTTVRSLDDLTAIEAASQRRETVCGDGVIVWHLWGSGSPLVLLHGGSGSWTHWVRNIPALVAAGYQLLVPDLPGFGDSAVTPNGRDADVMPAWLQQGLDTLIDEQACQVVGFSFGAMVGVLLAAEFPRRVRNLVLVGAPALSTMKTPNVGLRAWEHLTDSAARTAALRHNLGALMMANDDAIDELALHLHAANLPRDRLRLRRLARTDIVVRTLPDVQCPVAGIWGDQDAVYKGQEHTIEPGLSKAPAFGKLVVLPNTGHWAQYENAGLFNDTLTDLLITPHD